MLEFADADKLEKARAAIANDYRELTLTVPKDASAPTSDQEIIANMTTVLLAGNASIGHYFTNLMYVAAVRDAFDEHSHALDRYTDAQLCAVVNGRPARTRARVSISSP